MFLERVYKMYIDYNDCIVNLSCSIGKYFGLNMTNDSLKDIDEILNNKKPDNVVVILYDGMGSRLIERELDSNSFLRRHFKREFNSVIPPTTTASTRSVLTGLYPKEHGWLGWDLYFKELDLCISLFPNFIKDTHVIINKEENIGEKYMPYTTIIDRINNETEYSSKMISAFSEKPIKSLEDMNEQILEEVNKEGKKYIYAYFEEPDHNMHYNGIDASKEWFIKIDKSTEELCSKLNNTLVIVIADHGHKECSAYLLDDYPLFKETLKGDIAIESRLCSFRVKEDRKEDFVRLFNEYFSDDFVLKTKEEVINENLFGLGKEHERFRESLGDYLALAIKDKYFRYCKDSKEFISVHAGLTEDELKIPLIVIGD